MLYETCLVGELQRRMVGQSLDWSCTRFFCLAQRITRAAEAEERGRRSSLAISSRWLAFDRKQSFSPSHPPASVHLPSPAAGISDENG
jgi:hypothetical protein